MKNLINFLSDNFELVYSLNVAIIVFATTLFLAIYLANFNWKIFVPQALRSILVGFILAGQLVVAGIMYYVYYQNYESPTTAFSYPDDVLPDTKWVKDDAYLYYIDGNLLKAFRLDASEQKTLFSAAQPLREYHFSPDGRKILIATQDKLFLFDLTAQKGQLIDSVYGINAEQKQTGVVSGIRWAPDSGKFVYEISKWSQYSSLDLLHVYDLKEQRKRTITSPSRRISSLYWDRESSNLYYLYHESADTSLYAHAFDVKVYRISLQNLTPEFVTSISSNNSQIPIENLDIRGVKLYLESLKRSFGRTLSQSNLVSEKGTTIGIDQDDFLYFVNEKWFRKRLFRVPRQSDPGADFRYQYKGGELTIDYMCWFPGGKYVILRDKNFGTLVLEPVSTKIGLLIVPDVHSYGWNLSESKIFN